MTATVATIAPAEAERGGPRGMTWLLLRLHRSALWFWAMLVAVGSGALLWAYGFGVDAAEDVFRRMDCSPGLCDTSGGAFQRYDMAWGLATGLLLVAPILIAGWAGSSLIGRELEQGTARLTWTQSVTPARWLASKLALPAVVIASGTLVLTLLHRLLWSADGFLREATNTREWHNSPTFTTNGTIATAYALLALAIGVLAGMLTRKASSGLTLGVLGLLVVTGAVNELRPRLWPVDTVTDPNEYPPINGTMVDEGALTASGDRITDPLCLDNVECQVREGVVGYYREFHPPAHFWPLQLVETAVLLAVAGLAIWAAFGILRRRVA
ncbi:ABC transporter permease [Streptomyces sp. NPDC088387]|uniref:ABC transporter permease n=1 Tax=Streptomyces sp. NPDC088387 TaxID=3365859 RepID=UPI00382AD2F4